MNVLIEGLCLGDVLQDISGSLVKQGCDVVSPTMSLHFSESMLPIS